MTPLAWTFVGIAAVLAVADWVAVGLGRKAVEYVCKPATMVPLIAAAVALDPASRWGQRWFVAALVCSLAGDVYLMLPDQQRWFVPGLASFLAGHLAYIAGLAAAGLNAVALAVGVVAVAVLIVLAAPRIVAGARGRDPRLAVPVLGYIVVISVMVAFAVGSTVGLAIAGAFLFYVSDFAIGWSRFVADFRWSRLAIIVTYHSAQLLLVLSLPVSR